jgi:branched-subunit amino acid ABC-type transport system permease component
LIIAAFSVFLGLLIERWIVRYLYKKDPLDVVIATLGIGLVINGICGWIWGLNVKNLPTLLREGGIGIGKIYLL